MISSTASGDSFSGSAAAHSSTWVSSNRFISYPEHAGDFLLSHTVEIIRHAELARQETQPLLLLGRRAVDGRDAHHRLSGLGDDEAFTLLGASNQLREPRLGLMDVDGFHGTPPI